LSLHYLGRCGRILHHNVDKALLRGGAARPRFGGGELIEPIELYFAGRATAAVGAQRVPLDALDAVRPRTLEIARDHLRNITSLWREFVQGGLLLW
jgi:S-adenosylmethionine synthetase